MKRTRRGKRLKDIIAGMLEKAEGDRGPALSRQMEILYYLLERALCCEEDGDLLGMVHDEILAPTTESEDLVRLYDAWKHQAGGLDRDECRIRLHAATIAWLRAEGFVVIASVRPRSRRATSLVRRPGGKP